MTKQDLTDNQASDVKAALLAGQPIPNPTGAVLIMDAKAPGYFRKATPEEAREHEEAIDAATLAARKAPSGNDNP